MAVFTAGLPNTDHAERAIGDVSRAALMTAGILTTPRRCARIDRAGRGYEP